MCFLHCRCGSVEAVEAVLDANLDMVRPHTLTLLCVTCGDTSVAFLDCAPLPPQFTEPAGCGIPLVVYSALLSRGLECVAGDMDQGFGACTMIGKHNYATQELVNLLLTGAAHSNVFDGSVVMAGEAGGDTLTLRGTQSQGNRVRACCFWLQHSSGCSPSFEWVQAWWASCPCLRTTRALKWGRT